MTSDDGIQLPGDAPAPAPRVAPVPARAPAQAPAHGLAPRVAPVPALSRAPVRQRSWLEVRWRQFRHAPRPVVRAVLSSLVVAVGLAAAYVAYDVALARGADLPGGDLRVLALAIYVAIVLVAGSVVTWLVVPQPTGSGTVRRRSGWSAALGFFAAVPIAWLVMIAAIQIVRPLLG